MTRRTVVAALPLVINLLIAPLSHAQSTPARPAFEVATIKLDSGCVGDRQDEKFSPDRVSVTCVRLRNLIQAAYGTFANGPQSNPRHLQILGAPGFVDTDQYDINAKATGNAPMDQMFGPMLQVLLEDRFHLKLHRESRDSPIYALTVAKGGLKLQPTLEGSCVPLDLNHAGEPSPNFCGRMTGRANGINVIDDAYGMSMAEIAGRFLSNRLDRAVIDKTGLPGMYDAHLEFARDNAGADRGAAVPTTETGASIFTAVQKQLGLKLSPDKGPVEVLVIDHVEKPSEN